MQSIKTANPVGWALVTATRRHREVVARGLAEVGLRPGQELVLLAVDSCSIPPRQGELAQALGVEPPTVAISLRRLEAAGLVVREVDPDDARARRVRLTSQGRRVLPVARAAWSSAEQQIGATFSASQAAELVRLLSVLG